MRHCILLSTVLVCTLASCVDPSSAPLGPAPAAFAERDAAPTVQVLVTGLPSAFGSALGPGAALFVAEGVGDRIWRVDPETGAVTLFASGLPSAADGGVMDVAFIGRTAYALVSFVTPEAGGSGIDGIYRVDGPNSFTLVADIGAFNRANPPETEFFVSTGVLVAIEPFRGGFLVTDGHLNRVLHVTRDGEITVFRAFDNIVPTGLAVRGNDVYMAEAGPVPHLPADGKVVAFGPQSATVSEVAAGIRLAVDVEFGRGHTLFALSQGFWAGAFEGAPAEPGTGALVQVNGGTLTTVVDGLDRPISMEIIGNTAYVVTLTGEVCQIDNLTGPPFGKGHQ